MIFFAAPPRPAPHPDWTLNAPTERDLIARRIAAAKRLRIRRILLKCGLSALRRLRRGRRQPLTGHPARRLL